MIRSIATRASTAAAILAIALLTQFGTSANSVAAKPACAKVFYTEAKSHGYNKPELVDLAALDYIQSVNDLKVVVEAGGLLVWDPETETYVGC